ncbi:MAG: 16S rRNA (cytidine(1402)-2'-O)-methyltransferase [Clostridia bacterium]
MNKEPMLFLVATPIGNLEDMSYRAVRVLSSCDVIACEDTRQTAKLLNHYEIKGKLESYHQHNMVEKGPKLIQMMLDGKTIALVSDAGTPGISDPGEELVKLAMVQGICMTMIPGPVAGIMGLVLSGLDAGSFVFEGFLPRAKKACQAKLESLSAEQRTIVLYEAPHRLLKTLEALFQTLGNRRFAFARELTKKFEETRQMTLEEGIALFQEKTPKGEFVLIVEGKDIDLATQEAERVWQELSIQEHFAMHLSNDVARSEAMKLVAKERGLHKREVYSALIKKD